MTSEYEVRLAFQQGLLSGESLNQFQYWAARYCLRMNRRIESHDAEDILRQQAWYLNPDHYTRLFHAGAFDDGEAEPDEMPVEDIDEIDRYFAELENTRTVTGADVLALADGGDWV